jgi:hypothetical protein
MGRNVLKMSINEHLRHSGQNPYFVEKTPCFGLKVALFVEKRKNKFAYELKKNKFVFN